MKIQTYNIKITEFFIPRYRCNCQNSRLQKIHWSVNRCIGVVIHREMTIFGVFCYWINDVVLNVKVCLSSAFTHNGLRRHLSQHIFKPLNLGHSMASLLLNDICIVKSYTNSKLYDSTKSITIIGAAILWEKDLKIVSSTYILFILLFNVGGFWKMVRFIILLGIIYNFIRSPWPFQLSICGRWYT